MSWRYSDNKGTLLSHSDHYCIKIVAPSGDHYCIDIVVPSSDHCCTDAVPPSSDHCRTTKEAPWSSGKALALDAARPRSIPGLGGDNY